MKLYLVQHAKAKPEQEDPARPLSDEGRRDIERIANFLKPLSLSVSRIVHSGKLRAKQTAEVLCGALNSEQGVQEATGLTPLDDPRPWAEKLRTEQSDLMLVGHLPHLAKLAGLLLTGDPERQSVRFTQGGVFCFERDEAGRWALVWAVTPELVR